MERLRAGEILAADGATGTNLQARGLERGQPSETWLFERPEEIVRLHQDFLQAGADILLTCSFGASPLRLGASAAGRSPAEVNRRAVELARQAIQGFGEAKPGQASLRQNPYIAGSLGPSGQLLRPYGPLDEEQVFASYAEQAQALVEAGVDLLVIETQFDLNEASQALKAALQAGGSLPIVVSFSYDRGTRSMMGVRPAQMAAHFAVLVEQAQPEQILLGVNCGRSLEENLQALKELRLATSQPPNSVRLWFKPNAGLPKAGAQGEALYEVTPEAMGALVPTWIAAGAQIVGGCCGTSPAHLAAIAAAAHAAAQTGGQ
jgi:5-methyltetrahydrofolate--homocysteine methyltransferase